MKSLLVFEYRRGKLTEANLELFSFAAALGAETAGFLVGRESLLPAFSGKLYLADIALCKDYNPELHAGLILQAAQKENADNIVFIHSSYGWDLAPRVAAKLKAAQISEITGIIEGKFETGCCNGKMRRLVQPTTPKAVLTIQEGAFTFTGKAEGIPVVEKTEATAPAPGLEFAGYEEPEKREVDLSKAEVIVSAGRGIGKKDNVPAIAELAKALNGELGASRPVVDAGWVEHNRQVGATGQIVSPKLYVACGISGAIQHLTGMRNSEFVVAVNKDKEAPISEVADIMVIADVMPFVAALTGKIKQ
ncbi:MAG: electron transfer flavoprotein subunit alpha/FixB family protein [Elusimicrobia bacterium CG_4_10_14_0_2_um_filter_56_8]|nr:MAG: electron transfer flavoprotein subunit alpha/FixB family protein [Elusimicrobia bacterium CG_4_10_14_0_2_um_filter_56_8]